LPTGGGLARRGFVDSRDSFSFAAYGGQPQFQGRVDGKLIEVERAAVDRAQG
jgi:hypothetical protein